MSVTGRNSGLVLLLISSLLIIVPMVIFPSKLGISLATGSIAYAVVEIIYYGIVLFLFYSGATFMQVVQGAGLTFLYRIVLGSALGLMISLMYSVDVSAALIMGISRYLPAIIFHIVIAPFAIKPFYMTMIGADVARRKHYIKRYTPAPTGGEEITQPYMSHQAEQKHHAGLEPAGSDSRAELTLGGHDLNGFERAVRYLGENHVVNLAAIIDNEGLTVASFKRGQANPDIWAPMSLLLQQTNKAILSRNEKDALPDKMDISFGQKKLTIVFDGKFNLLVLADRGEDELIGIRTAQAVDMIKKYMSERYGNILSHSPEEQYVSNS
jgi:predicted regulator of Ras-like GTPase activity (Roadblock/LC7/MglB family)